MHKAKTNNPMSLAVACADFFGKQPGQTLAQFSQEFKALSQKDKDEIAVGLTKYHGYVIKG